jgi:thioredoxin-related protein
MAVIMQPLPAATNIGESGFDDSPLQQPVTTPDWFKLSFLDLQEDLQDARAGGKKGLLLYFGQAYCPYCKAMIENNFAKRDIVEYTKKYFDVIEIDVRGNRGVTSFDGRQMPESHFASISQASFTPTLIFYDLQGREVHRLVGYYGPYTFRVALEYVADNHYRKESFRHYLARGQLLDEADTGGLHRLSFAMSQPYALERNKKIKAQRPLLVIFEQGKCHACDVLHAGTFTNKDILRKLTGMDVVQLDIWADTPVIDPGGRKVTSKQWAEKLGIFYTPTLVFYVEVGIERLRLASVAHFNRIRKALRYMESKAYNQFKNILEWSEGK